MATSLLDQADICKMMEPQAINMADDAMGKCQRQACILATFLVLMCGGAWTSMPSQTGQHSNRCQACMCIVSENTFRHVRRQHAGCVDIVTARLRS